MENKIREKPGLYFGKPFLTLLYAYMGEYARRQYELESNKDLSKIFE
jgi:hypothetical protein